MYLAGVSVRRVESITEALWGTKVSPGTLSNLNKKVYEKIEEWRNRKITGEHPYVYLDGIYLKRSWGGEVKNIAVLVAIGVNSDGYREILGVCEGIREDKESWREFLRHLKKRGLTGVQLIVSDKSLGLIETIPEFYPDAQWQRCLFHFNRNVLNKVPRSKMEKVATLLKTIHAQEDKSEALKKSKTIISKLKEMKLNEAAKVLQDGIEETMSYYSFPEKHWRRIRTNNPLERINKEIRRRTKVVGSFPDGESALMLVAARLRFIAGTKWGTHRYLDMQHLKELDLESKIE
jgi:transposase-like protein